MSPQWISCFTLVSTPPATFLALIDPSMTPPTAEGREAELSAAPETSASAA